jgi:hypothetical protein
MINILWKLLKPEDKNRYIKSFKENIKHYKLDFKAYDGSVMIIEDGKILVSDASMTHVLGIFNADPKDCPYCNSSVVTSVRSSKFHIDCDCGFGTCDTNLANLLEIWKGLNE